MFAEEEDREREREYTRGTSVQAPHEYRWQYRVADKFVQYYVQYTRLLL